MEMRNTLKADPANIKGIRRKLGSGKASGKLCPPKMRRAKNPTNGAKPNLRSPI